MPKIAIITDSACDMPQELQKRYHIYVLDFQITLDGRMYQERRDFTPIQYYEMLQRAKAAPKTEVISEERYFKAFKKLSDEGYTEVIVVTIAASVSVTNSNAHMALARFYAECHDSRMRLYIVDSKLVSMAYGYPICVAAAMLEQGTEVREAVSYLEDCFSRIEIVFGAYTLKYLKMSGRTKGFSAFVGDLLHKRPMMSYIDGVSRLESTISGNKNLIPAICDYATKRLQRDQPYLIGTTSQERGKEIYDQCVRAFGYKPQMVFQIGASLATHLGPDGVGIVFFGPKRDGLGI